MKEFPIMAYLGVHNNPNTMSNYKQFAECGFNLSMWRFDSYADEISGLKSACKMAHNNGIGIIACTPEMYAYPEHFANDVKDLEGFAGYYIVDEPTKDQIPEFANLVSKIKSIDTNHLIYSNLHPYSCKEVLKKLGVKSYDEYLEEFAKLNVTHNSFDYYPIKKSKLTGKPYVDKKTWYKNLNLVKEYSEKQGKDFWAFILSTPHARYPQPTLAHMKLQAFTNMAFGAQGIEYFTYQTPVGDPDYDFHDGPIDVDYTTKTSTWWIVKQVNEAIKNVAKYTYKATDFKVVESTWCFGHHISKKHLPKEITKITADGSFLLSTFNKGTHRYMMLVNQSITEDIIVDIEGFLKISSDSNEREPGTHCWISAGGCAILHF